MPVERACPTQSPQPSRNLRILLLSAAVQGGGAERHFVRLAQGFFTNADKRVIVSMIAPSVWPEIAGTEMYSLGWKAAWDYPAAIARLRDLIAGTAPDIVYSFSRCANMVALASVAGLSRRPALVVGVNENLEGVARWNGSAAMAFWRLVEKRVYRYADLVLTNSPDSARVLMEKFRCSRKSVKVIRNPIPVSSLRAQAVRLRQAGSPLGKPYLLGFGRLAPGKGFEDLIDIYAQIAAESSFDLVILGDGPSLRGLREKAVRLGLTARIHFPGWSEDPLPWLASASVYVNPSYHEGLPNTVLEAMASGVPVVSYICTGWISDFAESGALVAVPVGDARQLRESLVSVLRDSAARQEIVQKADPVVDRFEAESAIREREQVVSSALRMRLQASDDLDRADSAASVPVTAVGGRFDGGK